MADDGYVTIFRTTDLAEGELVAELLQGEGIAARLRSVSAALIGAGPQIFETRVDVPSESEERAHELLADLAYVGAAAEAEAEPEVETATAPEAEGESETDTEADADDESGADGEGEPEPAGDVIPRRRPLLAGVAFLIPGGGHFYARRPFTGLVLLAAILYSFRTAAFTAAINRDHLKAEIGFGMFVTLFICDFVGGVRACRAANRGDRAPAPSQQIFRGLVLVVVAIAAGAAFTAAAAIPSVLLQRKLSRFIVRATPTELIVQNGDRDGRALNVWQVRLRVGNETYGRVYNIEGGGQGTLAVPAGDRGTMSIVIPEELRAACSHAARGDFVPTNELYPDELCRISFSLTAAPPGVGSFIDAEGACPLIDVDGPVGVGCTIVSRHASTERRGE